MNAVRTVSLACLFLVAAAVPALGPSRAAADDPAEAQLLVKCKKDEVPHVLAALAHRHVRVYDLTTMAELHGPGKTGALPSIPDAGKAMKAFDEVLKGLGGGLRVTEMAVQGKRLGATISIDGPAAADRIPAQIAESPYFRGRAARTELGAMMRSHGRWTVKVYVHFGSAGASDAPPEGLGSVPLHLLMQSAQKAGMRPLSVGAEQVSRDRRTGRHGTASREVTLAAGRLSQLLTLLESFAAAPNLTVTELRWKRAEKGPESDAILKSVVRVATRTVPR